MSDSVSQPASSGSAFQLTNHLINRIRLEGPITFHEWMREALYNDLAGYYVRPAKTIWGRAGDYRTSPERSELFAATFARFFAELYQQLDRPGHFHILECASGDGSFAEGVLLSLQSFFPDVYSVTTYSIAEIGPQRRNDIKQRLQKFATKIEFVNHDDLCEVNPGIVFANELLDAFPVHLVTKRNGELLELYVGFNASCSFDWVTGPLSNAYLRQMYQENGIEIQENQIIELSPGIDSWLTNVANKLRRGYLVTVDYGGEANDLYGDPTRIGGTLRAYARHQFVEVLSQPGEHDITAHVNWTRVQFIGARLGLTTLRFQRQDKFLLDAGLLDELQRRVAIAPNEAERKRFTTAAPEMILPNGMAASFQVLIQYHAR